MSEFEIDLGDGRTVVVDAPDAAQAANAARTFLAREKGSKPQSDDASNRSAFARGLGFGAADEIGSAIRATVGPAIRSGAQMIGVGDNPDFQSSPIGQSSQAETWKQRYDEELARTRAQAQADKKARPGMTTAGEVAGTLVGTGALMAVPGGQTLLGGGAVSLPGMVARGAASGAVLGGVQGFNEGEGGLENRASNAVLPAAVGGAFGGALPVVGSGAKYVYEKAAPSVLRAVGNVADKFTTQVPYKSLSAAAPDGGMITQDGLAATFADKARGLAAKIANTSRSAAGNIEGDAAANRLALEIARNGGTGQAREKLAAFGEDAFIADTSKGAERLAELGATLKGEAPDKYAAAYTARNERTGERFLKAMGTNADAPSVSRFDKFFEGYKSSTGSKLYDPVLRSGKFNVSPEMDELMKVPAIRETMDQIIADAERNGVQLGAAEAAHMVKQQLNRNTEAAFASGKAINKNFVRQAGDAWEQALWAANPAIKEADAAYAKVASLPEWRDRGLNFMKRGYSDDAVASSADALVDELPKATAQQRTAATVGASNVMADAAKGGAKSTRRLADAIAENSLLKTKLAALDFGQEGADRILKQARTELAFQAGNQAVNGGSPTGRRIASMADEAALTMPPTRGGDIAGLLGWVKDAYGKARQPSEAVRSRLADLLANPDAAMNAETLSLIDAILKQQGAARPVSAGISGAAGGSFASPR